MIIYYSVVKKMTIKEFKDTIWNDFEFSYNGVWYYICPIDNKYSCGEANHDDTLFSSPNDILENFMIQGQPLKNVLSNIIW